MKELITKKYDELLNSSYFKNSGTEAYRAAFYLGTAYWLQVIEEQNAKKPLLKKQHPYSYKVKAWEKDEMKLDKFKELFVAVGESLCRRENKTARWAYRQAANLIIYANVKDVDYTTLSSGVLTALNLGVGVIQNAMPEESKEVYN